MHTHLEQSAADDAAPGEQSGVRWLAQGSHLSRGQFLPEPRFEPTTSDYKSDALSTTAPPVLCILPILSAYAPRAMGTHVTAPREQLGVRCLAQGYLSRVIEGGESAGYSLPETYNSCWPETRTRNL